jgi:hypothetical protein
MEMHTEVNQQQQGRNSEKDMDGANAREFGVL